MIYWLSFIFSLLLLWVENYNSVLNSAQKAHFFNSPTYKLIRLIRQIIQYGSIIGIYFKYDILSALRAFVAGHIFGFVTFKIYFNKQVKRLIPFIKEQLKNQILTGDIDSIARAQAEEMVNLTVKQRL